MAFDYTKSQTTATNLLLKFGSLGRVSISRNSGGTFDPVEGETTGASPTVTTLTSVTVPIKKNLIDGERILATDIMFICNSDFEPLMTDTVVIDSLEYKIIDIKPLTPNGVDVIYTVICRG